MDFGTNNTRIPLLQIKGSEFQSSDLQDLIQKRYPKPWQVMSGVFILFIPIIINEILDLEEHKTKLITACGIPGNETFSLRNCIQLGIEDCSNVEVGTLRWDSYRSTNLLPPMLWWLTFGSFIFVLIMVEYSLVSFIGTAQTMLKLLTFRIYVGVQKRKFVLLLLVLVILFMLYAGLKFFTYYELSKDIDVECHGKTVRIRFFDDYENSLWRVLIGIFVMATVLKDPWWKLVGYLFNFYSHIDLKVILRDGSSQVLNEFSSIRKIEYADLLDIFDEFFGSKVSIFKM